MLYLWLPASASTVGLVLQSIQPCIDSLCLLVTIVAGFVEYPRVLAAMSAQQIHFNAPVLLANALAAFALNLVSITCL